MAHGELRSANRTRWVEPGTAESSHESEKDDGSFFVAQVRVGLACICTSRFGNPPPHRTINELVPRSALPKLFSCLL